MLPRQRHGNAGFSSVYWWILIEVRDRNYSVPLVITARPDRFSYPDASKFVGYPFREETLQESAKYGPVHLVALYKTITDNQIRKHVGNPDIRIMEEAWGFFAADPERAIQIAYVTNVTSPSAIDERVGDFLAWLREFDQEGMLLERSKVRKGILKSSSREI